MPRISEMLRSLPTLLLVLAPSCIASNVVAVDDRLVVGPQVDDLEWHPGMEDDLAGLFESVQIHGDSAGALWKIYYHFSDRGGYSGAALVNSDDGLRFQVLSGHWRFSDGLLDLQDGSERLRVSVSGEFLKLESSAGSVVFKEAVDL